MWGRGCAPQEKIEPPVYVSDRRLVKSIQLLQVRAPPRDARSHAPDDEAVRLQGDSCTPLGTRGAGRRASGGRDEASAQCVGGRA